MEIAPSNSTNVDGNLSISGMAIGQALSHAHLPEDARDAARSGSHRRADTRIGRVQPVESSSGLTQDEQTLLRIFVARRGQCLSVPTLERAFATARRARARTAAPALDAIVASLTQKLRASDLKWRVVAVDGCGYILWH